MEIKQNSNVVLYSNTDHENKPPGYYAPQTTVLPNRYENVIQDDYLFCSICNLLCGDVCLGIPALIFSIKARKQFRLGRNDEAVRNARIAKKLNIAGISIGVIIIVLYLIKVIGQLSSK